MGQSMYIVTDPELVVACQRQPKTLDFNVIMLNAYKRLGAVDNHAMMIVGKDINNDQGIQNYMTDNHNAEYAALAPGPALTQMNALVMSSLTSMIQVDAQKMQSVRLWEWTKHLVSVSATDAMYGPLNPISANPELENGFWDFEADSKMLLLNVLPSLTARKGYRAREAYARAFADYHGKGDYEGASKITLERRRVADKYGLSTDRLARWDLGLVLAILVNAAPSCFWLTVYVFSDPELLSELRREVLPLLTRSEPSDGSSVPIVTLDITRYNKNCPLLVSTYQETLRLVAAISSNKSVLEDTVIGDRYVLKKGGILQIPGGIIHTDQNVWGQDADEFNPRRFLDVRNAESTYTGSFRVFGGGATFCPGRHFARTEIMSFLTMLVLGFDLVPVEGKWELPEKEVGDGMATRKPLSDIEVKIHPREGFANVQWAFETGSKREP